MRGYQPAQSLPVREIRGGYNSALLEALKSMVVWRCLLEAGCQNGWADLTRMRVFLDQPYREMALQNVGFEKG
jgi:hypothetical protein